MSFVAKLAKSFGIAGHSPKILAIFATGRERNRSCFQRISGLETIPATRLGNSAGISRELLEKSAIRSISLRLNGWGIKLSQAWALLPPAVFLES